MFQRLMTVARDKLYLCGISIAADGLYLARGLQALKIIFVEIELQIGEVIKCCRGREFMIKEGREGRDIIN